jgi:predicted DNA-binding protein (MmcQ/YjbR family)
MSPSAKPGTVEDYPFGDKVAVFTVAGRMFALVSLARAPGSVSVKCDPALAIAPPGRALGLIRTPGRGGSSR